MSETDTSPAHPRPTDPGGLAERLRQLTQSRSTAVRPPEAETTEEWQSVVTGRLTNLETSTTALRPALDQLAALIENNAESQGGRADRAHAEVTSGITELLTKAEFGTRQSEAALAAIKETGALFPDIADAVVTVSDQVGEVRAAITSTRVLIEAGLLDLGAAVAALGRQLADVEEQRKADRERFRHDLDDALVLAVEALLTGGLPERAGDESG